MVLNFSGHILSHKNVLERIAIKWSPLDKKTTFFSSKVNGKADCIIPGYPYLLFGHTMSWLMPTHLKYATLSSY